MFKKHNNTDGSRASQTHPHFIHVLVKFELKWEKNNFNATTGSNASQYANIQTYVAESQTHHQDHNALQESALEAAPFAL